MRDLKRPILAASILFLPACATIRHGRLQQVSLASEPAGASASIRCGKDSPVTATTPATITVKRRSLPCRITLSKNGYRESDVVLNRRVSNEFKANLLWMPGLSVAGYGTGSTRCEGERILCTTKSDAARGFFILGVLPAGIGMAVDAATGAMYKSDPPSVDVTLTPQ